jgi:hypothetical protein
MDIAITVLLGFLLRIGIPVAVTALVLVILYNVDKHWQKEALALPVVPSGKRCWDVKGCSEEMKKNCPAVAQSNVPCWHVFRTREGVMKETCLDCKVFRRAPTPFKA